MTDDELWAEQNELMAWEKSLSEFEKYHKRQVVLETRLDALIAEKEKIDKKLGEFQP